MLHLEFAGESLEPFNTAEIINRKIFACVAQMPEALAEDKFG